MNGNGVESGVIPQYFTKESGKLNVVVTLVTMQPELLLVKLPTIVEPNSSPSLLGNSTMTVFSTQSLKIIGVNMIQTPVRGCETIIYPL